MTVQEKVTALRQAMNAQQIDAWILPTADPHQSEYLAPCWKERVWFSGFTGSAGVVVVTQTHAGLWTDSRYFIQAAQELEGSGIELFKLKMPDVPTHIEWLQTSLPDGAAVGFDGNLMSVAQVQELQEAFEAKQIRLVSQHNLLAQIWKDRPPIPKMPVMLLDVKFTGESRPAKFAHIREKIAEQHAHAHLMSMLDEIAWMFNIRGSDVTFNPVTIAYAYISQQEVRLFIHQEKLAADVKNALAADGVIFSEYEQLIPYLRQLSKETVVLVDPQKIPQTLHDVLAETCAVQEAANPAIKMKAVKNAVEIEGIRNAHVRDGAALVKWLHWLDHNLTRNAYTEFTLVDTILQFRKQQAYFQGPSFNTIIGYQPNAAMCHYSPAPDSALKIDPTGILLIDSGGQYLDGTTDITRAITLAVPTAEQKRDFTLVLKGHINIARAKFPKGTTGGQLDALARIALWHEGMTYGHGTGHGIGHFLNVHEGPHGLRPENSVPLEPGMVISNEPGVYREGKYGFRIENLIIVNEFTETEFGTFYGFETVTLCPIDLELVESSLLTADEKAWLNAYHQRVFEKLAPLLAKEEIEWLRHETRVI